MSPKFWPGADKIEARERLSARRILWQKKRAAEFPAPTAIFDTAKCLYSAAIAGALDPCNWQCSHPGLTLARSYMEPNLSLRTNFSDLGRSSEILRHGAISGYNPERLNSMQMSKVSFDEF